MKTSKIIKILKNKLGFTLIELIISLGIMAIIIVSLLPIFTNVFSWLNKSEQKAIAVYNTQSEIEGLLSGIPSSYSTTTDYTVNITLTGNSKLLSVDGKLERVEVTFGTTGKNIIIIFRPSNLLD